MGTNLSSRAATTHFEEVEDDRNNDVLNPAPDAALTVKTTRLLIAFLPMQFPPLFCWLELLLVAWGLCFIASRPTAPTLKARDLTECICRKEHSNARTVDSRRSRRYVEERAPSDTADRGAHHAASGGGIDGVAFGHHTVADSGSAPVVSRSTVVPPTFL